METPPKPGPEPQKKIFRWSVLDGIYNPNTSPPDETERQKIEHIVEATQNLHYSEEAMGRIYKIGMFVYAFQLSQPQLFRNPTSSRIVEKEIANAFFYCQKMTENARIDTLKILTPEINPATNPVMKALKELQNREFIDSDTRRLGDAVVRYLYVKHSQEYRTDVEKHNGNQTDVV